MVISGLGAWLGWSRHGLGMGQVWSNVGPGMVLVWPGIVQSWSKVQVDFSSLLVVIVVVVGSHLLQELAHHLGGLGAESESVSKDVKPVNIK